MNEFYITLALVILGMMTITVFSSAVFAEYDGIIFKANNGTNLTILKIGQEVNITFPYHFIDDASFDGYVYYNIIESDKRITQSQNFTSDEIPKTFRFSYTPQEVGIFQITRGAMSHTGVWGGEQSQSFIVIEKFSKSMNSNGQCKKPFPEFILIVKSDFSTGACVKMDTYNILKKRGWIAPSDL